MGFVVTNIGTAQNVPAWDIRCDTAADLDALDVKRIPAGSTAIIMEGTIVYILNTEKVWVKL